MLRRSSMDFETKMNQLKKITADISGGNISLEETIKLYKEGMKLVEGLEKILETANNEVNSNIIEK